MTIPNVETLIAWRDTARELAEAAGADILRRRAGIAADSKAIRRDLVTAADRAAEEIVVGGLQAAFPDHGVLAEEGVLTPKGAVSRADAEFVWIVDPIDGTTNYVHGLPFFAVAVGLVQRGKPIVGVVHAPALELTYHAYAGGGAWRGGDRIRVTQTSEVADALLATGFSYVRDEPGRDDNLGRINRALHRCRDLRRYGSAQLDLCMTAAGHFDGYWEVHLESWDVAAGACVVREAGGTVTDLVGDHDAWLSGESVLASNGALHAALLEVVGGPIGG